MSVRPPVLPAIIPVTEVPLKRKLTKTRLPRVGSDSSTYTTASTSSRDMATQTDVEPVASTAHSDKIISSQTNLKNGNANNTRMSGGASSDKSVTFSPTPATSPALEKSQAEAEGFVRDKKENNKEKRPPGFKRNLSSLWKMLDPPELAHNTGALHNLVKAEEDNHRRKKSGDGTTLVETIASRQYKQR